MGNEYPLAFPHVNQPVFFLGEAELEAGRVASRKSPRLRITLPLHRELGDGVQRMINFLQPGTYITPHHHPAVGFSETIFVIHGRILFVEFASTGQVLMKRLLTGGTPEALVDFGGTLIHTFICLDPDTVILEIKKGPYAGPEDKVFAPWAPPEGDPASAGYMANLLNK